MYHFNAEKESSTRRTLHADVNTRKGANGELLLGNSIPQNPDLSTASGKEFFEIFVYHFNAEKEPSTRRTLHADVNTRKGANGELFLDNSIPQKSDLSTGSGEKVAGNYDHRYMSPDLWRRTEVVDREIEKISCDSGEDVRVLSRELSENGKKEHRRLKQAFYTLYEASGGKLQMVVVEENKVFSGAYPHGDTIYISADAIENGTWTRALGEESTHFAQGTPEHSLLYAFLADDAELLAKVENELTEEGNKYKFTSIDAAVFRDYIDGKIEEELTGRALRYGNEVTAHMSAELLSNEAVIDRMISRHATLAERIMIKIRQIKRALARIKDAKAQFERLTTAEQIYLAAIERRGWRFDGNKIIMGADDEELDNEEGIDYNRKAKQTSEQGGVNDGREKDRNGTGGRTRTVRNSGRGWGEVSFSDDRGRIRLLSEIVGEREKVQQISEFADEFYTKPKNGDQERIRKMAEGEDVHVFSLKGCKPMGDQ